MASYVKQANTDVEKPQTTDVAMVIAATSPLPTINVASYLTDYLLNKIPVDTCQDCSHQLIDTTKATFTLPRLVCV